MILGDRSYEKVVIVEPHSDDAFLSLGGFLMNSDLCNVTLVTVGSGVVNDKLESAHLNEVPGFHHLSYKYLGYVDARLKKESIRLTKLSLGNNLNAENYFTAYNPGKTFFHVLAQFLRDHPADAYVFPMGLHHPMHHITYWIGRQLVTQCYKQVYFYLDFPYCAQKRVQDYTNQAYKLVPIAEILEPRTRGYVKYEYPVTNMAEKRQIFGHVYKSQWFIGVQVKDLLVETLYGPVV